MGNGRPEETLGTPEHDDTVRTTHQATRGGPGAPGAIAAAMLAAVALLAIGPLTGGETEPVARSTTTVVGPDPFDIEYQSTSTTLSTIVTPDALPDAFGLTQTDADAIEARIAAAVDFWTAIGGGDTDMAIVALDEREAVREALEPLTGFLAQFHAQFRASDCGPFGSNAVVCSVHTIDPAIAAIGLGEPTERLLVGFGSTGIEYVETPSVLGSASLRLAGHARDTHADAFETSCDPATDPQPPLPLRIGTLAATPDCGAFLAGLVREYVTLGR